MATTSSSAPILFSVLTSSHENKDDFVNQLRNHLTQIETNAQQTLNELQQRKPYTPLQTNNEKLDSNIRHHFLNILKDVAVENNRPFDELFFRQQFLPKQNSSSSPKVDVVRAKPSIITVASDPHLSPVNNTRRSQFAPVLSSTPVHQTSPVTPIPVDLSLATPLVLTVNATHLPAVPPSAIVPQRANLAGTTSRPPRIPRGESVSRKKKTSSPIKEQHEQEEELLIAKEVRLTSRRRIKTKQEIVEDNVAVIIEQQTDLVSDIVKQVQATPLRGRKKKVIQEDDNQHIPQLEPPPIPVSDSEIALPKKMRGGRSKKKEEENVKPARTASLRNRKKPAAEEEEVIVQKEVPLLPKKTTRSKKLVEPDINIEANPPTAKVRATPSRSKKRAPLEVPEPIADPSPKKPTTKSKKRKVNEDTNENPIDTIQPSSPKRRGGRNTRSKNSSPVETLPTPPLLKAETLRQQAPASARSSRRGKQEIAAPIEKQDDIVLTKKTRTARAKKTTESIITDIDVVMTSVTVSASVPSSSAIDSLVAKPPRPPVARKKKSIAMPPAPQMSPTTPPPTQRIQSTSPVNEKVLLPLPVPSDAGGRRRPRQRRGASSPVRVEETALEALPSASRNPKRTQSSAASTPKRARRENLLVTTVPGTPGKKRNKCTCEKRRHRVCDICLTAVDA